MHLPVRRYLALLSTYLKPLRWRTLLLALLLVVDAALQLINPQILRYFIDTALSGGAITLLLMAALLFIALALINQGITVAFNYLSEYIAWTATNRLRTDLVTHCLSLDLSFHKSRTQGEMIERIDGDVNALSNFFSKFAINLLLSVVLLLGILVMYFTVSWLVGVVMTIFSIATFYILMLLRRRAIPLQIENRQMHATFFGFLSEYLTGTEDIRANGATSYVMQHFYRSLQRWYPIFSKARITMSLTVIVVLFLFVFANALVLGLGAYLWSLHQATVGTVYLLQAYTMLLSQPLRQIQQELQDLQRAEASIKRVSELLETPSRLSQGKELSMPQGALPVTFSQVSFGYSDDTTILHNVSFQIEAGKVLGVLGRTGSGKTTIARLLFRLYDPLEGDIRIGNVPLRDAKLQELRQRIGMVTQDVQLFQASVYDNLTFFNRAIPDSRILDAIQQVGLKTWYQTLPYGLASQLEGGGQGLSAGEAQLLAFTRVLLTDPGLVILDEASSRLDPVTEMLLERATHKLFEGRTGLVIAHRLATIQRVDNILIIEDGRVVEYGERAELANNPHSHFTHLLQTSLEEVKL